MCARRILDFSFSLALSMKKTVHERTQRGRGRVKYVYKIKGDFRKGFNYVSNGMLKLIIINLDF